MKGYVRKKLIRGKARYYWCISSRDNSKGEPRQKVIAYLGDMPSVEMRRVYFVKQLRSWKRMLANRHRDLAALRSLEGEHSSPDVFPIIRRRRKIPTSLDELLSEDCDARRLEAQRITIGLRTIKSQISNNLNAVKRLTRDIERAKGFLQLCSAYA
jgi:hypothetical protein